MINWLVEGYIFVTVLQWIKNNNFASIKFWTERLTKAKQKPIDFASTHYPYNVWDFIKFFDSPQEIHLSIEFGLNETFPHHPWGSSMMYFFFCFLRGVPNRPDHLRYRLKSLTNIVGSEMYAIPCIFHHCQDIFATIDLWIVTNC